MLTLHEIRKSYEAAGFMQAALDGVSISFRDNEFAAVLGPSGSGKTTMLNIIGGLDHYGSGDLFIDGVSTKKYRARDWDTYRNNRIGFVFQSYNLIPHQTVLANVELALTLSGVSAEERRERAIRALEEVGLKGHIRKKPTQLSGGQMQRVAIARALINDPEIVLADEPTGALDTHTGKQVMDLLTAIAKDRLVVMVTHNGELAEQYANRIIHLTDGKVTSDSRPFDPAAERQRAGRKPRKAGMSFLTALSLSLSNLMTKKGRTFVTSLAGSIGIIGIAAILALTNGINAYIQDIERETLSVYPLSIQKSGFDFTSLLADFSDDARPEKIGGDSAKVKEQTFVGTMFSNRNNNDLKSLKVCLDQNEEELAPYVNAIQYQYDITPQIYLADTKDGVDQANPDSALSSYGLGATNSMFTLMGGSGGISIPGMPSPVAFHEMPDEKEMFERQYFVEAGRWPARYDETVLVLSADGSVTDLQLYTMGLRDRVQLKDMVESLMNGTESAVDIDEAGEYSYELLMSAEFRVACPADQYKYGETYGVWVDKSSDKAFMKSLVDAGLPLKIVGIVLPDPDATATTLSSGINYTPGLIGYLMEKAKGSPAVRDQIARPLVNVLTGKTFAEENEEAEDSSLFKFADLLNIDEDAIRKAFAVDASMFDFDLSSLGLGANGAGAGMGGLDLAGMDLSGLELPPFDPANIDLANMDLPALDLAGMDLPAPDLANMDLPPLDMAGLTAAIAGQTGVTPDQIAAIMAEALLGFLQEEAGNGVTDIGQVQADLQDYLVRGDVQAGMAAQLAGLVDPTAIQDQVSAALQQYMQAAMQTYMAQMGAAIKAYIGTVAQAYMAQMGGALQSYLGMAMQGYMGQAMAALGPQLAAQFMPQIQSQIEGAMKTAMAELPSQMQNAFSFDPDAFAEAFGLDMGEEELLELMQSIMNPQASTYERNLTALGFADPADPTQINIYPLNFDSKDEIEGFLARYNDRMEAEGEDGKVIHYTDLVGTMMSSVTDIINTISMGLIAFVAISLVVSSIMIGVITYISVLERKKEIGILRALGASRRNIREVFNAETLIIGFASGVLGIAVTLLISIPANVYVYDNYGIERIVRLPLYAGAALVAISMFLTFIAGLFPSQAAAHRDPVEALRSE
ncbi:MAG: ATP-binding cassette domain-containing protein [Clostridiales Family XIII bacterium]|jgi:ABC-type lipoprotein export system ATPase subunit|nr:ATP-binding cassette domain-containing protein [Clostridiales Family XIII bacterium]